MENNTNTLGTPHATAEILKKYDIRLQKKYGQNFLIDGNILEGIVEAAGITKDDLVIEIGPGIGTMTQLLSQRAYHVAAVEIDSALIPVLHDTLEDCDNVTVINEDIMKMDLKKFVEENGEGKRVKIVANLPYYITTPIVMGLLEGDAPYESITIMVQKEAAERMQAGPGSKIYGAMSLAVSYYTKPQIMLEVPSTCFIPRPKVDSAVIRLDRCEKPPVDVNDKKLLFALIRASFNQRRKTLANGICNGGLGYSRQQVTDALLQMELSPSIRGEQLSLSQFARLSDLLGEQHNI